MTCFPLEVHLGMGSGFHLGKELTMWHRPTYPTLGQSHWAISLAEDDMSFPMAIHGNHFIGSST